MSLSLFKIRTLLSALVPALYLALVLFFDWSEPFRTVTPPLCTMGLLCMAALVSPGWMVWWASVYSAVVFAALLDPKIFAILSNGYQAPEITSHKFRVAGFIATAFFSCVFSFLLTRLRTKRAALSHLIAKMPVPTTVTDSSGRILLLNEEARLLVGIDPDEKLSHRSFFDLFAPTGRQGECISNYIRIFKNENDAPDQIDLEVNGVRFVGWVELLESRPRQLITMLIESNA
jgi:PAS domain-containing protein